jgi:hypothetical protein
LVPHPSLQQPTDKDGFPPARFLFISGESSADRVAR